VVRRGTFRPRRRRGDRRPRLIAFRARLIAFRARLIAFLARLIDARL
jgi:hypothetical protein